MTASSLSVAQIGFHSDLQDRAPEQLLQDWPTLSMVANAAALGGAQVTVIQASSHSQQMRRGSVDYHFLPLESSTAELRALLARLRPDVLHVQGLQFGREAMQLPALPLLLQDHANAAPRRPLPWLNARRAFARSRGLLFCASEQALPFMRRGLIARGTKVHEVAETSSHFAPVDQALARQRTGVHGNPALLWVAHLDANKDPMTMLDGVSRAAEQLPELQLWCCFVKAPLMAEVQQRIAGDARLAGRVHLLGPQPHERIEELMNAADFLVQASHREGSGYALIEALACGLAPIVTDIPSFRALTGRGEIGWLWPCGESEALANAIVEAAAQAREPMRRKVRAHFESALSPKALGRRLCAVYEEARRT